jgi:purine nucleosidase
MARRKPLIASILVHNMVSETGATLMQRKVIIDCDPGVDDAIALMLAIRSEQFDVQAITTVCGNSPIEDVTRNAAFLLELLGRSDIPVYSGAAQPLVRPLQTSVVHGVRGLGRIQPRNTSNLTGNAAEKIVELVDASHGDLTLIALGPLTNVAQAIRTAPQSMSKLKEITMMGGAIRAPGNISRVAEFNIFVDPEAAEIVFRFSVPLSMVPLDACNKIRFRLEDFRGVGDPHLSQLLVEMAEPYIHSIAKEEGEEASAPLYDPLTIYYLVSPASCESYRCHIAIETEGVLTRGMSVADLRPVPEFEANTTVVDAVDEKGFRDFLMRTLKAR